MIVWTNFRPKLNLFRLKMCAYLNHIAPIKYLLADGLKFFDVVQHGSNLRIIRINQTKSGHIDEVVAKIFQVERFNVLAEKRSIAV